MHLLHDARRDLHVPDFRLRLHDPLPVHEAGGVEQGRFAQMRLQRTVRGGAEVVVVHLHADARSAPPALLDHFAQAVHRMALGGLHVVVRVADDVVVRHEHGALRAVGVHGAPEPHRVAFEAEQHALVHVERPAVVAGKPRHVRRVADDEEVESPFGHRPAGPRDAPRVLLAGKPELDRYGVIHNRRFLPIGVPRRWSRGLPATGSPPPASRRRRFGAQSIRHPPLHFAHAVAAGRAERGIRAQGPRWSRKGLTTRRPSMIRPSWRSSVNRTSAPALSAVSDWSRRGAEPITPARRRHGTAAARAPLR